MTTLTYAREADRLEDGETAPRPQLDLTPVEGDWTSATGLPGGIQRLRTHRRDGSLAVHATGLREGGPVGLGEVRADGVFANALRSTDGYAFLATFGDGEASSHLQTYQGLGVLVVHAFHRFADGRRDHFTREFYVPSGGQRPAGTVAGEFPPALRAGENDPGALLGTWEGLAPAATKSIATLECALENGFLSVRARGVGADGPVDWGPAAAQLYADAAAPGSPPAFLAVFDHGYMRVHLQARINRGVLVVGEYTQFTDGSGRSDYFIRECYRRG